MDDSILEIDSGSDFFRFANRCVQACSDYFLLQLFNCIFCLFFQELSSTESELSSVEHVSKTRSSRKSDGNVPPHVPLHHRLPVPRELGTQKFAFSYFQIRTHF